MTTAALHVCPRCQREVLLGTFTKVLLDGTRICLTCKLDWENSPEHERLEKIFTSLLAEFVERERCEQLNHTTQDKGG